MKKIILYGIMGLLLIVFATAGIISLNTFSKDIETDKTTKDKLALIGITNPIYTNTYCDADVCEYCGKQILDDNSTYGTGCVKVPIRYCDAYIGEDEIQTCSHYTAYTEEQQKTMQAEKVEETLKGIAEVYDKRNAVTASALGDATYNIKEKGAIMPK